MAKKFSFYGKTLEEVQALPLDEFIKLIPCKQRRMLKRMNYQARKFLEKFRKHKAKEKLRAAHVAAPGAALGAAAQVTAQVTVPGTAQGVVQGSQATAQKKEVKESKPAKPLRTHFREMVILPEMVGSRIQVYDGKTFIDINIIPEMMGHRLGEYAITTKMVKHGGPGIGATRGSTAVDLK
ncbi:MAG: ribosomal protein S19 family protein [Candidatus Micrarchaeota archaeon]